MNLKKLIAASLMVLTGAANAQMIHGNTFPFWTVTGALTVGGASTFTGAITANGGLVGTATNDSATAGNVGELKTTTVAAGSAVAGAATTVSKDLTSVSLTAGDWDVDAACNYVMTGMTATVLSCGLGTTTATQATQAGGSGIGTDPLTIATQTFGTTLSGTTQQRVGPTRVSLAATTTIYLVVNHTFSAGSYTMYGTIRARRVR